MVIQSMNNQPLHYRISSLRQLPECLSNNSKELHIHTSEYINNDTLTGFQISIDHDKFGRLFSYVVNPSGAIVTDDSSLNLQMKPILGVLAQYGFLVEYNLGKHLTEDQLTYLRTINELGYDKLRTIMVKSDTFTHPSKKYVVVFNLNGPGMGRWLDNTYVSRFSEFNFALASGYAAVISNLPTFKDFSWDWLDYVANIVDILNDNIGDGTWI